MKKFNIRTLLKLNMALITGLTVLIFLMFGHCTQNSSLSVVTVDVPSIVNSFIEKNNKKELGADEVVVLVDGFSEKLSNHINKISKERSVVVIPKQATIAGGYDITQEIKNEVIGSK
jgi:c-di-AMP phosphodiesterase-like protein